MKSNKASNRKVYIDFLKVIAIYMVLFNHTGADGFILFTIAQGSKLYPFYLFNAIFIKIAVPLFFMTSGALLLGKEEAYKDLLIKRFFKYLIVLIISSLISYMYICLRLESEKMSIAYFFKRLYTANIMVAFWYLYAYLAYILMLPMLRKMAKSMTDQDYRWMFLLFGFMQSLSIIDYLLWQGEAAHNGNFSFFITNNYVFYPLMGYYIDQRMKQEQFTRKTAIILTAVSIIAITVCCFMTHYKCTLTNKWSEDSCQTFFNTLIFLPTITVYYVVKMWFMNHSLSDKVSRLITAAGETVFGIYLIERICRSETRPVLIWLKPFIHTLPACWIWILTACIFGGILVFLLKKIPIIRNFI